MTDLFQMAADALATILGQAPTTCGTGGCGIAGGVLGFGVIVVLIVALTVLLGAESMKGIPSMTLMGSGIAFVVIVGWWPQWAIVFIALLIVFAWFTRSSGTGGLG